MSDLRKGMLFVAVTVVLIALGAALNGGGIGI